MFQCFIFHARLSSKVDISELQSLSLPTPTPLSSNVNLNVIEREVEYDLCLNNANKIVSCELVALENLFAFAVPSDFQSVYGQSVHKLIPFMRHPIQDKLTRHPFPYGVIRTQLNISNLNCYLIHSNSNSNNKNNIENVFKNGVIIYFPGGAYITGTSVLYFKFLAHLSLFTQLPILSVEYRLAPEFAFQGGYFLEDARSILIDYLHNELEINYSSMWLMGDSAGAGVCLIVAHYLKSEFDISMAGQILISPTIDASYDANKSVSLLENQAYDVLLSLPSLKFFLEWRFGCRDINGKFQKPKQNKNKNNGGGNVNGNQYETIEECVQYWSSQIIGTHFSPATFDWNVFDSGSDSQTRETNFLFVASQFEVLRDESIRAHELALNAGLNSQLMIVNNTGIHCLPIYIDIPESRVATQQISQVINSWKNNNKG